MRVVLCSGYFIACVSVAVVLQQTWPGITMLNRLWWFARRAHWHMNRKGSTPFSRLVLVATSLKDTTLGFAPFPVEPQEEDHNLATLLATKWNFIDDDIKYNYVKAERRKEQNISKLKSRVYDPIIILKSESNIKNHCIEGNLFDEKMINDWMCARACVRACVRACACVCVKKAIILCHFWGTEKVFHIYMIMVCNVLSGMGWALAQLLFWWCSAALCWTAVQMLSSPLVQWPSRAL